MKKLFLIFVMLWNVSYVQTMQRFTVRRLPPMRTNMNTLCEKHGCSVCQDQNTFASALFVITEFALRAFALYEVGCAARSIHIYYRRLNQEQCNKF